MRAERIGLVLGMVIATTLYAPFAIYVLDVPAGAMAERAYFLTAGVVAALIALK